MTTETALPTSNSGQQESKPKHPLYRKKQGHIVLHLLAISVLLGLLLALTTQIAAPTSCKFIAAWSPHLESSLVPDNLAAANDRLAIQQGDYFSNESFQFEPSLSSSMLRRQLLAEDIDSDQPLVVYLSALASVDTNNQLVLMTKDFQPLGQQSEGIPLLEILSLLAQSTSQQKLLILDISAALESGQAGLYPEEITDRAITALAKVPDDYRLTLVSSGVGQNAQPLLGTGRTLFGYFFEQGISGWADGFNDSAISDGRVSAREVAAYVTNRVDGWSVSHGENRQTPLVLGDVDDFVLTVADRHSQPPVLFQAKTEAYPDWLKESWQQRTLWLNAGILHTHPRLIRRLDETLIEIERRWRYGADDNALRTYWISAVGPMLSVIEGGNLPLNNPLSLGSLAHSMPAPSVEAKNAWSVYFSSLAALDYTEAPKMVEKQQSQLLDTLQKSLQPHNQSEVLLALLEVLPHAQGTFTTQLTAISDYLQLTGCDCSYVETAAIIEISNRLDSHQFAEVEDAQLCLQCILLGEQACGDTLATPDVSHILDQALSHRLEGEVLLFNPGYGPIEQGREELSQAIMLYEKAIRYQRIANAAIATRDRSFQLLPAFLPIVRTNSATLPNWKEASVLSKQLADLLQQNRQEDFCNESPLIEQLTRSVKQHCDDLESLLSQENIDALLVAIEQELSMSREEAEAVLATPLLSLDNRLALLKKLESKSEAQSQELDHFARQVNTRTIVDAMTMRRSDTANATFADRAIQEAECTYLLGEMGGLDMAPFKQKCDDYKHHTQECFAAILNRTLAAAYRAVASTSDTEHDLAFFDRVSRVLPAGYREGMYASGQFHPSAELATQVSEQWRSREQQRFALFSRNPLPSSIYAVANQRLASAYRSSSPAWAVIGPVSCDKLSEQTPTEAVELLISTDHDSPALVVLSPNSALSANTHLSQQDEHWKAHIDLDVQPDAAYPELSGIRGILARIEVGSDVRYYPISLPNLSRSSSVEAWIEVAGIRRQLANSLTITPASQSQPFELMLQNRMDNAQSVTVHLDCGETYSADLELPPGQPVSVPFPATKDPLQTPLPLEHLGVTVLDQSNSQTLYTSHSAVTVLSPENYMELAEGWIESAGEHFTLHLPVRWLPGGPRSSLVELSPSNGLSTPSIHATGGQMAAVLDAEHPMSTLTCRFTTDELANLTSPPLWSITIDGVQHTYSLQAPLPNEGETTRLELLKEPRLTCSTPSLLKSGAPLEFATTVYSAPRNATIEARLLPADTPSTTPVRSIQLNQARVPQVTLSPPDKKGRMSILATMQDAQGALTTDGLVGTYKLNLALTDERHQLLAKTETEVTLDNSPANQVLITPTSPQLVAGAATRFEIKASDNLSGVSTVHMFAGSADGDEVPKGVTLVPAHVTPGTMNTWGATLPLPANQPTTTVSAVVTNGVGLARIVSRELRLKTAVQAELGSIAGQVSEGGRLQPGLTVELRSPDQKVVAKTTTQKQGNFEFGGVKPGAYLIWCTKLQSQRTGTSSVKVEKGQTAHAGIELSL
ncbi:carboxypeptidase-like regulatory domain-containing protein [Aeoliella mucimassa]|uniref:Uncharacterized protein n=1 Tax=Aeoliella mucimassa TaxID=2527972 RepID=A0A518AUG4_9BACT|nr:carboxypeptidase-like regulatory domain-containing protein [Aeoliella mucimassa]QDU58366.1 hypothetical protein Pan181_46000 [Aeoliella mucimassa]